MSLAKKLLSAALALVGLALAVVGIWFAAHLGGSGTATFTTHPTGSGPVILQPSLLNRVDQPVKVHIVPTAGGSVWVAVGAPSDVSAAVGATPATRMTEVAVRHWTVVFERTGSGTPPALASADIWREQLTSTTPVDLAVEQRDAPETIVVDATKGQVGSVEVSWQRQTWFFQSLVVAVLGLMVTGIGLAPLVGAVRRRARTARRAAR